ncbi:MAG TPA: hypothetical protein VHI13_04525 [Candidatus Kapabacteria bacterium]|nr:hypothetical protein [Candidatus Kapabacteria bacterium]
MSNASTEPEEPAPAEPVPQMESHLGAVHILHAVVGGVVEYLQDKGDSDGEWLASALLNVNRLIRNTLPAHALDEQHLAAAFVVVQDAARHAREAAAADWMDTGITDQSHGAQSSEEITL